MNFVIIGIVAAVAVIAWLLLALAFRTVVPTNMVHIVQSRGKTTSYGTGHQAGNVYFRWPGFVPFIGISRIMLPVSNFDLSLHGYKAYDKDRVPFELDVTAFFRIADTDKAAQRVENVQQLRSQLEYIVQGAVRKILASHDINTLMVDRATFGEQFTKEVNVELQSWGVEPVKNMELMDLRDADGSKTIANIMAKKASHIEMESRIEVAQNKQLAQTAEIEAQRTIDINKQDAEQKVGERTADAEKAVGIAREKAQQEVKSEAAVTAAKNVEVRRVETVGQADIDKQAAIVAGEQEKAVKILDAEAQLEAAKREAEGVRIKGEAEGAAEQAVLMAPVNAQIALAEKIEDSAEYQSYLIAIEFIKAQLGIGTAQAQALTAADIKVIANAGNAGDGLKNAMQLFSGGGGLQMASMLENFGNLPEGRALLDALRSLGKTAAPAPAVAAATASESTAPDART